MDVLQPTAQRHRAFMDHLNLLLGLLGHPLLYVFLYLNNGFLHPRLNVVD